MPLLSADCLGWRPRGGRSWSVLPGTPAGETKEQGAHADHAYRGRRARRGRRIANRLCAQLLLLSAEDPRSDISLYINSPGGSVSAGLAIYDTMRLIPNDVSTLAMGLAGSMGQFLLSAGTPGKRYSLPHAQVLMHQGSAGFGGTAADVEIYAEQLEKTGAMMVRLIAKHTGQPIDRIEQDSRRDRWFAAEEARDYGLIDHILDRVDDVRPGLTR